MSKLTDEPVLYGLIGYPLEHSFSPEYFKQKFLAENTTALYRLFPIKDISELKPLIKNHPALRGLNVTIPYKSQVFSYLDDVDDIAAKVGAVNCIKIQDRKLTGYNTDVHGFTESLKPLLKSYHNKALILGNGGAAKAVKYSLRELGIDYTVVSKSNKPSVITYSDISEEIIEEYHIIINTTPLGMYPDIERYPAIPYQLLTDKHLLYDLVYNPAQTEFLKKGEKYGATTKNGQEMLQLQAEASWRIWNS